MPDVYEEDQNHAADELYHARRVEIGREEEDQGPLRGESAASGERYGNHLFWSGLCALIRGSSPNCR